MDALSLFSGCGGLDLGMEQAGFNVRLAVEQDHDACDSLTANFPDLVVVEDDIWDLIAPADGVDLLLEKGGFNNRPDLLVGGPPCKAFSKSGNWLEWKRMGLDPQATLLQAYTHVLREARPKRFILENVYGLTYRNRATPEGDRGSGLRLSVRGIARGLLWLTSEAAAAVHCWSRAG